MKVHQITAGVVPGDAVSDHVFGIDRTLQTWGFETDIFAEYIDHSLREKVRSDIRYKEFLNAKEDLLIYHYSVYSSNMEMYLATRNKKILIYHNITPPSFFKSYDKPLERVCSLGLLALPDLKDCDWAIGDSEFNRQDLVKSGFEEEKSGVLPIFMKALEEKDPEVDEELLEKLMKEKNGPYVIFVGRVAPNKAQEEIIKCFYFFQKCIQPDAKLFLIGHRALPPYNASLDALVQAFLIGQKVTFTGKIGDPQLRAYYRAADLFLSMSKHEGFGVPLVEAMFYDIPVIAYNSTAVPYTMGNAGALVNKANYMEIAELMDLVTSDQELRESLLKGQRERWQEFTIGKNAERLREALVSAGVPVP